MRIEGPISETVAIARAIAHPSRLRTIAMLQTGELCVCQITAVLAAAPSTVSAHLRELRRAGLINERREGRWVWIELADDPGVRPWVENALASAADDEQMLADREFVDELRTLPVEDVCRRGFRAAREKHLADSGPGEKENGEPQ